jgi:hypothetical protein
MSNDNPLVVTIDLSDSGAITTVPYAVTADRAALSRLVETFQSGAEIYGRLLERVVAGG